MPRRIQRRRTKGFRLPPNTVCITRGTKFGNPYRVGVRTKTVYGEYVTPGTIQECIDLYRVDTGKKIIDESLIYGRDFLEGLRHADYIACFCKEDAPCHGDVLLDFLQLKS